MKTPKQIEDARVRFLTACVTVLFVCIVLMFVYQRDIDRRAFQTDEQSIHEREEMRNRILSLEKALLEDRAAYGNRGIIQKSVMIKAIERGWFTKEEAELLRGIAEGANYPK